MLFIAHVMDRCGQPKGGGGCHKAAFVSFTKALLVGPLDQFTKSPSYLSTSRGEVNT